MTCQVTLRPFRWGDEDQIRSILNQAAMTTVWPLFLASLRRELTWQLMVTTTALLFVVMGLPLINSLLAFPILIGALFSGVWIGHKVKVLTTHNDLENIPPNYMSNPRNGFWVAVVDKSWLARPNMVAIVRQLNPMSPSCDKEVIVGSIAIILKPDPSNEPPGSVAWLKRMAVSPTYRRLGIGAALTQLALEHCAQAKFRAVELLTTEHHQSAHSLYLSQGFELTETIHRRYLGGLISLALLRLRLPCILIRSPSNA